MGLNIGVKVKQQREGYMEEGSNPKGTLEEISERVRAFVESKVPNVSTDPDYPDIGAYTVHDVELRDGWYVFDCRPGRYGGRMPEGFDTHDITHALVDWVLDNFGSSDLEMQVYFAP
jgi:hypothetical protein